MWSWIEAASSRRDLLSVQILCREFLGMKDTSRLLCTSVHLCADARLFDQVWQPRTAEFLGEEGHLRVEC